MRICPNCGERFSDARRHCDTHSERALLELGPDANDPRVGTTLGERFLVLGRLGQDGIGAIYRAWHEASSREVVVRVVWGERLDDELRSRAVAEVALARRLVSPRRVALHELGELADGSLYLAMDRVEGRNLAQVIAEGGRLSLGRHKGLALQLCDALSDAHTAGVLHRDVKPSSLMVTALLDGGEQLVLLELGMVKPPDLAARTLTREGMTVESLATMSPEQIDGGDVGAATDIYGCGLTLFALATGVLPFRGETAAAIMYQHLSEAPPHLMSWLGTTPTVAALDAVIQRCLRKQPSERFQSVAALREALEGIPPEARSATLTGITRAPPRTRQPTRPRIDLPGTIVTLVRGERSRRREVGPPPADPGDLERPPPTRRKRLVRLLVAGAAVAIGVGALFAGLLGR